MKYGRLMLLMVLGLLVAGVAPASEVQITDGAKQDMDPAVSPDGTRLAFASNRTGSFCIYLVTFGQHGVVQLTQSNKDDRNPAWSPDGTTLIFDSKRTGRGDLYEVSAGGRSGFLQLTDREDIEAFPAYTRDGQGIIYATQPYRAIRVRSNYSVVLAEDKGRANNPRLLADDAEQPRFSPDGSQVVFVSRRTKNKDIWIMSAGGGMQTQLTTDRKDDDNPCFSPDGTQIVFSSERTGNADIWVMNADGTNLRQLTSNPAHERQPVWSKGGYIYFTREASSSQSNIFRIPAP